MLAFIRGQLVSKTPPEVVVDVGGVGLVSCLAGASLDVSDSETRLGFGMCVSTAVVLLCDAVS